MSRFQDDRFDEYDDEFDDDEFDDDDEVAAAYRPPSKMTLAAAAPAASAKPTTTTAAAAAAAAATVQKQKQRADKKQAKLAAHAEAQAAQVREAGEAQLAELSALQRVSGVRVRVTELGQAGRSIVLSGAKGWRLTALLTPLHPTREAAQLSFEPLPLASDSPFRADLRRRALDDAFLAVQKDRVGRTLLLELALAFEAAVAAADAAPEPVVEAPVVETADLLPAAAAADDAPPAEFVGSLASTRPFALPAAFRVYSGSTTTAVGSRFIAIGGIAGNGDYAPLVRVFDVVNGTYAEVSHTGWETRDVDYRITMNLPSLGPLGRPILCRHSAVLVGNKIFCFGGHVLVESRHYRNDLADRHVYTLKSVSVLDVTTMTWSFIDGPLNRYTADSTATRVGDSIFVIGGVVPTSNWLPAWTKEQILEFDLKSLSFRPFGEREVVPPAVMRRKGYIPAVRENMVTALKLPVPEMRAHTATRVGHWIVLHGGVVSGDVSSRTFAFDTRRKRWLELPSNEFVRARKQHCAVRLSERFVAFIGGRSALEPLSSIDIFDLQAQRWHQRNVQTPLLARVDAAAALTTTGEVLLFGGFDEREQSLLHGRHHFVMRPALIVNVGLQLWAPTPNIGGALAAALESGAAADVHYRHFKLHSAVLAARCPHLLELIATQDRSLQELRDETLTAFFRHVYGDEPLALSKAVRAELAALLRLPYLFDEPASDVRAQAALAAFFDDDGARERTADVTFVCGDSEERIRVHRFFVTRSEHFKLALSSGMAEERTSEVRVDDVSADVMRAFLRFLYTDALECEPERVIDVLLVADRFDAPELKQHAESAVEATYDFSELPNLVELIDVAERCGAQHLLRVASNALRVDFEARAVQAFLAEADTSQFSAACLAIVRAAAQTF